MIQVIVFSKNRPLQLHGYLTSFFKHWNGHEDNDFHPYVYVIVRAEPPYTAAYEEVYREFAGRLAWLKEREGDFAGDVQCFLEAGQADLISFGCDDAVFTAPVDVYALHEAFKDSALLGVSFRLGRNITRGMFGDPMPQPFFLPEHLLNPWDEHSDDDPSLLWDVRTAPAGTDWAYPWELVGTVYDGDYARGMVSALTAGGAAASPNQLEHMGSEQWRGFSRRYLMRAYPTPRLVLSAVNVVQTDFPNGIVGAAELTPEYLLDLWNKGIRLDVDEFAYRAKKLDTWRIGNLWLSRQKVAA